MRAQTDPHRHRQDQLDAEKAASHALQSDNKISEGSSHKQRIDEAELEVLQRIEDVRGSQVPRANPFKET